MHSGLLMKHTFRYSQIYLYAPFSECPNIKWFSERALHLNVDKFIDISFSFARCTHYSSLTFLLRNICKWNTTVCTSHTIFLGPPMSNISSSKFNGLLFCLFELENVLFHLVLFFTLLFNVFCLTGYIARHCRFLVWNRVMSPYILVQSNSYLSVAVSVILCLWTILLRSTYVSVHISLERFCDVVNTLLILNFLSLFPLQIQDIPLNISLWDLRLTPAQLNDTWLEF